MIKMFFQTSYNKPAFYSKVTPKDFMYMMTALN